MVDLERLWASAELSQASYARLGRGTNAGENEAALTDVGGAGMASGQAKEFSKRIPTVVLPYEDSISGNSSFSATVFKDAVETMPGSITLAIRGTLERVGTPNDLSTDADIWLAGAGFDQIVAMANWWRRVASPVGQMVAQHELIEVHPGELTAADVLIRSQNDSLLVLREAAYAAATGELVDALSADPDGRVDVTGHSLGGHLAMAFSTLFPQHAGQVTVFNAPGFDDNATTRAFFAKLGGVIPGSAEIVNVIADEALVGDAPFTAIAGLHSKPGEVVNIAIENQWQSDETAPFSSLNHSITALADSLAIYKALADLDPSLTPENYRKILNQATQGSAAGYERIVDSLNLLFRDVADVLPAGNTQREHLYDALYKLGDDDRYTARKGKVRVEPTDVRTILAGALGETPLGYRYALVNGDPLVVVGDPAVFSEHNKNGELELYDAVERSGTLTPRWLEDRASYMQRRLDIAARNEINDIEEPIETNVDKKTWAADDVFFEDRATAYRINQGGQRTNDRHVVFGSERADAISGSDRDDALFGAGGTDYLKGGGGDDYIEGGRGLDVYQYAADAARADGADTLLDVDGRGVLRYTYKDGEGVRQSTILSDASIALSDTRWESADSRFGYATENDTLTVTVSGVDGALLTIRNFRDGDYGIHLWNPRRAAETTYAIAGDLAPRDVDPAADGLQTGMDSLGNVLTDASTAEPDRADMLYDSEMNDAIAGGGGNDTVTASRGGDDAIAGGDGRDWLDAGSGNDLVTGGAGGTYDGQAGGDVILGRDGDDSLFGDVEAPLSDAIRNSEVGTGGEGIGDFMSGGRGDDRLVSGAGNDLLSGGDGRDLIVGGAGDDDIRGDQEQAAGLGWTATRFAHLDDSQPSFTALYTGVVILRDGRQGDADVIYGGAGNDWISGETGDDFIDGGSGDDVLYGTDGMDVLVGGVGDDWIAGGYTLAQAGQADSADYLEGGEGDDHLYGDVGEDVLIGGPGADYLAGGEGKDIYVFDKGDGEDRIVDVPSGNDLDASVVLFGDGIAASDIKFRRGSLMIDAGLQDPGDPASARDSLHFEGFNPLDPYATPVVGELRFADGTAMTYLDILDRGFDIDGTSGDDNGLLSPRVEGTAVNDRLQGFAGNDILVAFDGNDALDGGPGGDQLDGGAGDDYLNGGPGIDVLNGGPGNDTYVFDPLDTVTDTGGYNTVTFAPGIAPTDLTVVQLTVFRQPRLIIAQNGVSGSGMVLENTSLADQRFSLSFADGATLTLQQLAQTACFDRQELSGTSTSDVLTGYAGDDYLYGGAGDDALSGGGGYDTLYGEAGNDILSGDGGNDTLFGNFGDDTLNGGAGDDSLDGGDGNDTLRGGPGHDLLYGREGADTYAFSRGDGRDSITDLGADGAIDMLLMEGLETSDVELRRQPNGDLTATVIGTADEVTVSEWYLHPKNQIERIVFADGAVVTKEMLAELIVPPIAGAATDDRLVGTAYADTLTGLAGNDYLDGGKGDDTLEGGAGEDTYVLNWDASTDTVTEIDGESSTVVLALVMTFEDIDGERQGDDLLLHVKRAPGGLRLRNYFAQQHDWQVEQSNGEVLSLPEALQRDPPSTGSPAWDLWAEWKTAAKASLYGYTGDTILADGRIYRPSATATLRADAIYFNGERRWISGGFSAYAETYTSWGYSSVSSDAANQLWLGSWGSSVSKVRATFDVEWADPRIFSATYYMGSAFGLDGVLRQYYQTSLFTNYTGLVTDIARGTASGTAAEHIALYLTPPVAGRQLPDPPSTINADFYRVDYQNVGLELRAGPSNNVIGSRTFGIIDAGAGNDLIDNRAGGRGLGNVLFGGPGADRIIGSGRADLIIGGPGNDRLAGASGDDIYYVVAADSGVDVINEATWYLWDTHDGRGAYNAGSGFISTDTVEFGPGISLADLRLSWGSVMASYAYWSATPMRSYETLDIAWAADKMVRVMLPDRSDRDVVLDMDVIAPGNSWGVEYFKFSDGTRITADDMMARVPARSFAGTDDADVLVGQAGSDVLMGGPGDDLLQGDTGNDTYVFNAGDGVDTIRDARGNDTILFGPGITASSIGLGLGSLLLRIGDDGDAIHVEGFDPLKAATSGAIEALEFSDGTRISYAELLARGFDLYGTVGSDVISGTSVADRLRGYEGDDILDPGAGDDTLDGGAGDDILRGGAGSDRYVFSRGFGHDRIEDHGALRAEIDTVVLDALPEEVSGLGQDGILTLTVGHGAADELHIVWDPDSYYGVEQVQFSDGTVWDESVLRGFFPLPNSAPVPAAEIIAAAALEDAPYSFTLPADAFTDPDPNDVLTLSAMQASGEALPPWLTFNPATATFTGLPDNDDVGVVQVIVTAADQAGLTAQVQFAIEVLNVNDPPVAFGDTAQAVEDGGAVTIQAASLLANDVDVDAGDHLIVVGVTESTAGVPVVLDAGNAIYDLGSRFQNLGASATIADEFAYTVADDSGATAAAVVRVTVIGVNDAPALAAALPDRLAYQNAPVEYALAADLFTDIDAGDVLTLAARSVDGSPLPAWLTFDAIDRVFRGTPDETQTGAYSIAVTATDSAGATATAAFNLTVSDAGAYDTVYRGTKRADVVTTSFANDVIDAGKGDDVVSSMAGRDVVFGGQGDDRLALGYGNDIGFGGKGKDTVDGGPGHDLLVDGHGGDRLDGGAGNDVLLGGEGKDELRAGDGNNLLAGGPGGDTLHGGAGYDVFAFNRRDGKATIVVGDAAIATNRDTLSFGAGISARDIVLRRSGEDLVVKVDEAREASEDGDVSVTLKDWYGAGNQRSVTRLQIVGERTDVYDFTALVADFDAATRGKNTPWRAAVAMPAALLASSADEAIGGALAQAYGQTGSLASVSVASLESTLADAAFARDPQSVSNAAGDTLAAYFAHDARDEDDEDDGWIWPDLPKGQHGPERDEDHGPERHSYERQGWRSDERRGSHGHAGLVKPLDLQAILEALRGFASDRDDRPAEQRSLSFSGASPAASEGVSGWALTHALWQFHLSAPGDAALGSDDGGAYGRAAAFPVVSIPSAQAAIGVPGFGRDAQSLQHFGGLHEGLVRLG